MGTTLFTSPSDFYAKCRGMCQPERTRVSVERDGYIINLNIQYNDNLSEEEQYFVDSYGKTWYHDGQVHRDNDKPAVVRNNGSKHWYKDGKLHRDGDMPAVMAANGDQTWYKDGEHHRDNDLPNTIRTDGAQFWSKNYWRHREDGPAVIYADGTLEWRINGQQYTPHMRKL